MYDEYGNLMEPAEMSFFEQARSRISSFVQPVLSSPEGQQIEGQLYDAIYSFGRGKIDAAREKVVGAFLMTSEGRKAQNEAIRQTANQYFPAIAIGGAAILLLLFALFSKK